MAKPPRQTSGEAVPPSQYPMVPPPAYNPAGHDFTLQTIIELQRSVGELCAKVDRLIGDVKSQGDKIDALRMRVAWVTGGAAVVGVLVGAAFVILRYVPWNQVMKVISGQP
jgi:hypothetical protein